MLVFTSGYLGLSCLKHLVLSNTLPDLVVLADNEQKDIEDFAKSQGLEYIFFYKGIQEELVNRFVNMNKKWLISFWSNHILKKELIECFSKTLNIHPSLVPLNQGNDCAAWTIRDNTKAGVSIMTMKTELDIGDVYIQKELSIDLSCTGKILYDILLKECGNIFYENWLSIYNEKIIPTPQEGKQSFHTRKDTNKDRVKDAKETLSLEELIRWGTSHNFYPSTTAIMTKDEKQYKIIIEVEEIEKS